MRSSENKAIKHENFIPDANWKQWTHDNLASSKNLWVTDIDTMLRSRNGCFVLVELKCQGVNVPTWQRLTYGILATLLKNAEGTILKKNEYLKYDMEVKHFCGVAELVFEKTWFDDGKVYLNGEESTEEEIRDYLSFGAFCPDCFPKQCKDCCKSVGETKSDNDPAPNVS